MSRYIEVEPISSSICFDCCHRVTRTIEVKNLDFLLESGTIMIEDDNIPDVELADDEVFIVETHYCKETASDIFGRVATCSAHEKRKLEQYLKDNQ